MTPAKKWTDLGWHHPLWNIIRLYTPLNGKNILKKWEENLKEENIIKLNNDQSLQIPPEQVNLFFKYMEERERLFDIAFDNLREEEDALSYCEANGIIVGQTKTKSKDHHQSSKAMVAAVSAIAKDVCISKGININSNPQGRCAWHNNNALHVTTRNLDGAIPSLVNPSVIWEIKEYWGKTSGGSKMSDALYECHLVGFELREYEKMFKRKIKHIVFLDGKIQWSSRKSDLKRFIDIMNQGLIDYLIIGKEVESEWRKILEHIL